MNTTPLPPTWITLMPEAEQIVKGKHVYKRFIDGTPLSNDVPCWMVEFALEQVAQARADLEAENKRLREALEACQILSVIGLACDHVVIDALENTK